MKENLEVLNEQNITIPVILGGAALTRRYVDQDLKSVYKGNVFYANDAFDGLRLIEEIKTGKTGNGRNQQEINHGKEEDGEELIGTEAKIALMLAEEEHVPKRSKIRIDVVIPKPPFWGSKVAEDISLDEVFRYVNEAALIRGQWRVVRGKKSEEEYKHILREQIYPEFEAIKSKIIKEKLLEPKAVYGYFPCQSDGNDLIIYDPKTVANNEVQLQENQKPGTQNPGLDTETSKFFSPKEWLRFSFPRQIDDRFLCISDYFAPVNSGKIDVVAFHLVTMGKTASEYSKKLFDANEYKDYLYFHGLSVESAEALAELWHKKIREELGFGDKDSSEIKRLFSQGYQGSRFSFGYPACPNLEDHKKLFDLLKPERIGVTMTDEFMLNPEQTTDAIIVHHPEARYFNIK
jgi:5-methyltetrahydrofolate--homocysteine methyltransferase